MALAFRLAARLPVVTPNCVAIFRSSFRTGGALISISCQNLMPPASLTPCVTWVATEGRCPPRRGHHPAKREILRCGVELPWRRAGQVAVPLNTMSDPKSENRTQNRLKSRGVGRHDGYARTHRVHVV